MQAISVNQVLLRSLVARSQLYKLECGDFTQSRNLRGIRPENPYSYKRRTQAHAVERIGTVIYRTARMIVRNGAFDRAPVWQSVARCGQPMRRTRLTTGRCSHRRGTTVRTMYMKAEGFVHSRNRLSSRRSETFFGFAPLFVRHS